jgi:enoyl-CoA hydratase/carnithine racemase
MTSIALQKDYAMHSNKSKLIGVEIENHILTLSINNPPHNYLPGRFFLELDEGYQQMTDDDIHAVIITGSSKVFSKGADIHEFMENQEAITDEMLLYGNEVFNRIEQLDKPVIAAISGACLGGGFELALCCNFRLCSEKSRLGLPEVSIGVIPGLGGIQRLTRLTGQAKALELVLLGEMISAQKALSLHIVNRVFPKENFLNHVNIFVKTILSAKKEAIQAVISLARLQWSVSEKEQILNSARQFLDLANKIKHPA